MAHSVKDGTQAARVGAISLAGFLDATNYPAAGASFLGTVAKTQTPLIAFMPFPTRMTPEHAFVESAGSPCLFICNRMC